MNSTWKIENLVIGTLIALFALASCGGDKDESGGGQSNGGAGSTGSAADFCVAYGAQCPNKAEVDECHTECANGDAKYADMTNEHCWFKACGAEAGKCDGEEKGDASILACATKHNWRHSSPADFCAAYAAQCPGSDDVDECHTKCANGDVDQADMTIEKCWFHACGVEVGKCDGEEPHDASIDACGTQHNWK